MGYASAGSLPKMSFHDSLSLRHATTLLFVFPLLLSGQSFLGWGRYSGGREAVFVHPHTLLKPTATRADIVNLCAEARDHSSFAVCLNPVFIGLAKAELAGSDVKVAGRYVGAGCGEERAEGRGGAAERGGRCGRGGEGDSHRRGA